MTCRVVPDDFSQAGGDDNDHPVTMTAVIPRGWTYRYLRRKPHYFLKLFMKGLLQSREEAGHLLSHKLEGYKNSNAVVVGIPYGGVCVAAAVAESLSLPLDIIACRKIKHPAENKRCIGSVGAKDVVVHDSSQTIPQDYVSHQIALLRSVIQYEHKLYYPDSSPASLRYKTVILVDDILKSGDAILACLLEVKRQQPLKVIVAVPVVTAEAARLVRAQVDDIHFLRIMPVIHSGNDHYANFPKVDESKVKELLVAARRRVHKEDKAEHGMPVTVVDSTHSF